MGKPTFYVLLVVRLALGLVVILTIVEGWNEADLPLPARIPLQLLLFAFMGLLFWGPPYTYKSCREGKD